MKVGRKAKRDGGSRLLGISGSELAEVSYDTFGGDDSMPGRMLTRPAVAHRGPGP